jgi:hypothetical protein
MLTATGLQINIDQFKPEDVRAWDIAWSLHHLNLFNGHAPLPWDALSHTGLAYLLYVQDVKGKTEVPFSLALLLYAAGKAYETPDELGAVGETVWDAIYERFNVSQKDIDWDSVRRYDKQATAIEFHILFPDAKDVPQLEYPLSKYPLLVKAKPEDYVTMLKHLSINHGVANIAALFNTPESLRPYLAVPAEESEVATQTGKVSVEPRETQSIEGLSL